MLLFVYGSLKRGFENAAQLQAARFVGTAETALGYQLVSYHDDFPALARGPSSGDPGGAVQGEIYEVDELILARLDEFEECPTLYQRGWVQLADGQKAQAYVIEPEEAALWPALPDSNWQGR